MELNKKFLENKYEKYEFEGVTEIDLKCSRIKKIKPNAFKALEHISEFKGQNKRVETLNLDYNEILDIEAKAFHYLPNLKHLNLSNNKIKRFDSNIFKKDLVNLETLHLNNNELEKITIKNLSNLKELFLNGNKLSSIESDSFKWLTNLKILNLEDNSIQTVDYLSFSNLKNLKVLKLNQNKLMKIDRKCFEPLKSIQVIQLYDNELNVRSFFVESTELLSSFYNADSLREHGFLSDWEDFLKQFPKLIDEIVSMSRVLKMFNDKRLAGTSNIHTNYV